MNSGSTAAIVLSTPLILMSTMAIQLSIANWLMGPADMIPALAKTASTLPKRSLASATSACMSSRLETSLLR